MRTAKAEQPLISLISHARTRTSSSRVTTTKETRNPPSKKCRRQIGRMGGGRRATEEALINWKIWGRLESDGGGDERKGLLYCSIASGHKSTYLGHGGRFLDFFYVRIGCDCEERKQQPRQKPETDYKVFLIFRRRTRRKEKITSTAADVQMGVRNFAAKKFFTKMFHN